MAWLLGFYIMELWKILGLDWFQQKLNGSPVVTKVQDISRMDPAGCNKLDPSGCNKLDPAGCNQLDSAGCN